MLEESTSPDISTLKTWQEVHRINESLYLRVFFVVIDIVYTITYVCMCTNVYCAPTIIISVLW